MPRDLSPDEEQLWRSVAQQLQPLQARARAEKRAAKPGQRVRHSAPVAHAIPHIATELLPPLRVGQTAGIDKRLAQRFRRGDMPVDATLDLHGFSCELAQRKLSMFIQEGYVNGCRLLLVITGKGLRRSQEETERKGVLREQLPAWIAQEPLRGMVLALDHAQQRHGGTGAFYVLLRRRR